MLPATTTKRGSRAWFEGKLNSIEAAGGEDARALASDKWASLVWSDPIEAAFTGADAVERIQKLASAAASLKDEAAKQKIESILFSGDDVEISRIAYLLDDEKIKKAVLCQGRDEERIRMLADLESRIKKDPTGHLKARRRLRMETKQAVATINMTLGLIGSNGHHHITQFELDLRNQQKARWRKFGEATTLKRGDEEISMLDVMKSAHGKKLAEILRLIDGLEKYAKAAGLDWAFVTLSTPPRMHCNPKNGHSTWDGTTPVEANNWIANGWGKVDARLRTNHGIVISGMHVPHPHLDACPHWHALIFAHPDEMKTIKAEFQKEPQWKSEPGMKFKLNDGTASASTYAFKYILSAVNSIEELEGETGEYDAWRSTWGIRGFQWFGMPPIKLWRDIRAIKENECPTEPLLAGLWHAAKRGDAHAFIGLAGGLNVKRKDRPILSKTNGDSKTKSIEFVLQETGESIKFDFPKWQREQSINCKPNKHVELGVILSYPSKSKAESKEESEPTKFASGRQGNYSLDPIEGGRTLHSQLPSPSILPHLSNVGIAENQHGTDALVSALQDQNREGILAFRVKVHNWWDGIDMTKAPSLANCYDNVTGKPIYRD